MIAMPVVDGFTPGYISELFYHAGAVQFHGGLPNTWIAKTHTLILRRVEQLLARVRTMLGRELGLGKDAGYAELVQRSPGRYDMACEWGPPFSDAILVDHEGLMPAVRAILGGECRIILQGAVISLPNAPEQHWHIDGPHLFTDHPHHLPAHCPNVFIPLIDITEENGPTQICPWSHVLTKSPTRTFKASADNLAAIHYTDPPVNLTAAAGSIFLLDYRLLHRGLANRSLRPRPILYLVIARPWYRDTTFPTRTLVPPT
jgi:Phytanoyl-CoA dioxygenase (PhyH)